MYQHLAHHYDELFPIDDQIKPFIKQVIHQKGYALDLGCGTGRVTQIIHDLGMEVTGIDLDETMIEIAHERHPNIKFKVLNMLHAFEHHSYDLVTCFGNTLPHLDESSLDLFFDLISTHLSMTGVLVVQMLNYDLIMKNKPASLKRIEKEGIVFERNYTYLNQHILFHTRLIQNEVVLEGNNILYPHQKNTLEQIILKHQLKPTFLEDDFKTSFKQNSPYLTLLVHKT
jgi:glycine/sarcosine N-methyltransferase